MKPNSYHREILSYLKEEYNITTNLLHGSNHFYLSFEYNGKNYRITLHTSSNETNIVAMKKQDIRRELGNPPENIRSYEKRKLEDMITQPTAQPFNGLVLAKPDIVTTTAKQPVSHGSVACYKNGSTYSVRFRIPTDILTESKLVGNSYKVKSTSQYDWEIFAATKGQKFNQNGFASFMIKDNYTQFGASSAEFICVDGTILVHLNKENIKLIDLDKSEQLKKARSFRDKENKIKEVTEVNATLLPPAPLIPTSTLEVKNNLPNIIDINYIKKVLDQIRNIEKTTPYRLMKTKEEGKWIFSAPRIE